MKSSGSINLFVGILVFVMIWLVVTQVLEMRLLGSIFDKLVSVGVVALIILFQEEIRRFLLTLGSHRHIRRFVHFLIGDNAKVDVHRDRHVWVTPIVMACSNMSKQKTGALIVIEHSYPMEEIIETGEEFNAEINQRLIENIFFKNSPLHDGAMIIKRNKIRGAGCILPVSHDMNIPKELGLRHRAAMGMSQQSDAHVVVVSEETGDITVAYKGQFFRQLDAEELDTLLTKPNENGQ